MVYNCLFGIFNRQRLLKLCEVDFRYSLTFRTIIMIISSGSACLYIVFSTRIRYLNRHVGENSPQENFEI